MTSDAGSEAVTMFMYVSTSSAVELTDMTQFGAGACDNAYTSTMCFPGVYISAQSHNGSVSTSGAVFWVTCP